MTQDIIEMARQAGMELDDSFVLEEEQIWYFCKENFIAFAKLVAADAAAKERETCARVCEDGVQNATDWDSSYWDQACQNRAEAIRARRQE